MAEVLLTVSGSIAPDLDTQIAAGRRPVPDYVELARVLGADLIDYSEARRVTGLVGRLLERMAGPEFMLAWACFLRRRRYRAIFTDGEQIGLPLAFFWKLLGRDGQARARHIMIVHVMSVKKKMVFLDWFRVQSHIDRFLVYATAQKRFIEDRWQLPPGRVLFTPFMVDTAFFAPERATPDPQSGPMICSVGLERRDYPTLLAAVQGLDLRVVIAAASPWARQPDTTEGQAIPANVMVRKFSQYDLRQLYADSRFVVMPLFNVDFQAGVTAILEAMAMGKAVICSRTPGQTDVVVEGETGLYVPPGDVAALRTAIQHLLAHPEEAERLGRGGRQRITELMSLELYTQRLSRIVADACRETTT